jgi:hypothetical protein
MARGAKEALVVAAGGGAALAGAGIAGVGVWAHRESRRTLARERIVVDDSGARRLVDGPRAARALAAMIRDGTLESTQGRTYAETAEYLAADGTPTSDAAAALEDPLTGTPVRNPEADLWVRSTSLQTALNQAYLAFRLADLMVGVGLALVATGVGLAAAARG